MCSSENILECFLDKSYQVKSMFYDINFVAERLWRHMMNVFM